MVFSPRRSRRPPVAVVARGAGGVPSSQQGVARQGAVWTGRAGGVRLRTAGCSEGEGLGTARQEERGDQLGTSIASPCSAPTRGD
jgi:hypothetical protein